MTQQLGLTTSQILFKIFGKLVQTVGWDLFQSNGKTVSMIVKSTGLPRIKVIECLRTLLNYDLATFKPSHVVGIAKYLLIAENVLLLIRQPRYHYHIKSKYGNVAELLVEELLKKANLTASELLITIAVKYKDEKEKNITLVQLRDTFVSLATAGYIQQAPVAEIKEDSELPVIVQVATIVPTLDIRPLVQALNSGSMANIKDNVYWKLNFDRFHQDFRDDIMIKAITRRIDDNAGELMRYMLQQMYLNSAPWAQESNPITAGELRECCRRAEKKHLHQYLDQYLRILEDNGAGFVRRLGDVSGGQYAVQMKNAALQLVNDVMDNLVTERFGSKAARIFRVIRSKKRIEEGEIQKEAMLPNKECKELTYKLVLERLVSVRPLRKPATANSLARAIYLYHVDIDTTLHVVLDLCLRSLHNMVYRSSHEREKNKRLLEKRRRVQSIVHGMRLKGEPEQSIADIEETITEIEHEEIKNIDKRLKQLSIAELELDKAIFIVKWCLLYTVSP